jgi:hypothetical protein
MKNKVQDYHISKGACSHFYILNDGEFFVKNLSTDLDKAISKAKEITGKDVPVSIWLRSINKSFRFDTTPKQHNAHVYTHSAYLNSIEEKKHHDECKARDYLGEVGDICETKLELVKQFNFEGAYGSTWCLKFKDINNWRYIYFGSSKEIDNFDKVGDKCLVRFQIKRQAVEFGYLDAGSRYPYKQNHITKIKVINKILDNNENEIPNQGITELSNELGSISTEASQTNEMWTTRGAK